MVHFGQMNMNRRRDTDRIDKINYYLDIAQTVMEHSNCLHRSAGAIIVQDDVIVSTGYSHMARQDGAPRGECYEHCRVVHAEATAITGTPRELMLGATLYLVGREIQTGELLTDMWPCTKCLRHIIRAGIVRLVSRISPKDYNTVYVGPDCTKKGDSLIKVE